MQEQTHPARMFGRLSMPLTLLAQSAGATITNAGLIHHAQAAFGFPALFGWREQRSGGTTQRAIRLASKISTREAASFPGLAQFCRSISLGGGGRLGGCRGEGWCKLGRARWLRTQVMAQLQAQIPDPTSKRSASTPVRRRHGCTNGLPSCS